jgi:hypothetical protein
VLLKKHYRQEIRHNWRSWDRASWCISTVKPTRCTIFEFIEYHSTCYGRSFRPSSGVQDCTQSIMYMSYWNCKMGKITVEFIYIQNSKMLNKMGNSQLTWYVHIEFYFNFFYFIGRIYCIFWMYFNILSFNLYSQNFTYNASHISLLRIYTLLILPILFYILLICIY